MKFPFRVLHGLEDAQYNFEALEQLGVLGSIASENVQVAFGTGTVTWPGGSTFSNFATVNHGLGRVPVWTAAGDWSGGTVAHNAVFLANGTGTAASFQVSAEIAIAAPAAGATRNFWWLAIG